MKKLHYLFFSLSVLFSTVCLAAPQFPLPEVEKLSNGLQVVWFLSNSLPVVDMVLLVNSGSREDPPRQSGLARITTELLDQGAGGLTSQQLAQQIESLGASRSANADDDIITVGMHGLAPDANTLLDLFSKMVIKPNFSETDFNREKERMLDGLKHLGDSGDTLAALAYHRVVSQGTSYLRGGLYGEKELLNIQKNDLVSYHQKHFTPANSILMVVGRVDKIKFKAEIEKAFGSWKGGVPERKYESLKDDRVKLSPGQWLLVERAGLNQVQVRMGMPGFDFKSPDYYPLCVANALLGEYFNSRLNAIIRDKLGLTYSIGSGVSYSRDFGVFTIASSTRNDSVGQLITKTQDILRDLRTNVSQEEFTMAKNYLIGGFPLAMSTLGGVAARWLSGYAYDRGPNYLNEYVSKIEAVTREQVLDAIKRNWDVNRLQVVIAGDGNEVLKNLPPDLKKKIKRLPLTALQ